MSVFLSCHLGSYPHIKTAAAEIKYNKAMLLGRKLLYIGALLLICALPAAFLLKGGQDKSPPAANLALCKKLPASSDLKPMINCIVASAEAEIIRSGGAATALPKIERQSEQLGGAVREGCHIAMHLVGSRLVKREKVTLATMQNYLPQSDATNCSGGFTHGMISVMGVTPGKSRQIATSVCANEPTRARKFTCIHGIGHGLRRYLGSPSTANRYCSKLGSRSVASDCAQGVYHDFFLAAPNAANRQELSRPKLAKPVTMAELIGKPIVGRQQSSPIDRMCMDQPTRFLRECWYRLLVGPGIPMNISGPKDILYACGGLPNKQQEACTAALATGRTIPDQLVKICSPIARKSQRLGSACVDGIDLLSVGWKVSNQPEDAKTFNYWKEKIPLILSDCQRLMPSGPAQDNCVKKVAQFSFRTIPVGISLRKAQTPCFALSQRLAGICRSAVRVSFGETLNLKS